MAINIGIDIDDTMTFIQDDLLKYACQYDKELGNSGKPVNDNYFIGERFNWSREEYFYFMSTIREKVVMQAKIRDGLHEFLTKVHDDGNKIIIITARSNYYYKDPLLMSQKWLKDNNIIYDKLLVNCREKKDTCQKEKIDLFIDDSVRQCLEVSSIGIKTLIMDNKTNLLNDEKITRIYNFYDAIEYYDKMKNVN